MLSLAGNENIEAKLGISKNIHGIDLEFNENQNLMLIKIKKLN